jgi:tetratricopeptide (TPR) repeat protein
MTLFLAAQSGRTGRRSTSLILAVIVFALLLSITPMAAQDDACDATPDYLAEGKANISEGDYWTAAASFACAIQNDPNNYQAYFWRGGLAGAEGDYDQLGNDLYTFMSHRSGRNDSLRVAIVQSLPGLTEAVNARPDDSVLYLLRGLATLVADLNAVADFEHVIELAPENAAGYLFAWLTINQATIPDFTDPNFVKGAELAADSILLDWMHAFSAIDISQSSAQASVNHFNDVIAEQPAHPFAYAARGMASVLLKDTVTATNDYYEHIQNTQTSVFYQDALELGTTLKLNAVAGRVYHIPLALEAGERLNISANRSDGGIFYVFPITGVVLNPAGELMPAPYTILIQMGGTQTPITGLEIPESGTYTLVVAPNYSGEINIAAWEPGS